MKFAWISTLLLLAICSFTMVSCHDNDDDTVTPAQVAGKGGSTTLHVAPQHDSVDIDSCHVYIKYNANVPPTTIAGYDDSAWVQTINNAPKAAFIGLKKGQYLLYGKGWDKVRSQTVTGSRPYTISADNTVFILDLQLH